MNFIKSSRCRSGFECTHWHAAHHKALGGTATGQKKTTPLTYNRPLFRCAPVLTEFSRSFKTTRPRGCFYESKLVFYSPFYLKHRRHELSSAAVLPCRVSWRSVDQSEHWNASGFAWQTAPRSVGFLLAKGRARSDPRTAERCEWKILLVNSNWCSWIELWDAVSPLHESRINKLQ